MVKIGFLYMLTLNREVEGKGKINRIMLSK
jgi:hypothetical protein